MPSCANMERNLPQPGFWMASLLVVLVFWVQLVLSVPLGILDVVIEHGLHQPPPHLERQPLLVGSINLVACGAAIALGLGLNRLLFRHAFPIGRITALQVAGVSVTLLGAVVLLSEGDNLLRALLPPPQWLSNWLNALFFAHDKLLSRILLLVIIAPLTEELLFRGIILRGLLSRHRPAVAVVLTALLFAALHCNPWQFLSPLFLGIAFGWFYLRTGSVGLCVLAHAFSNGLVIVLPMLPLDIPGLVDTPDNAKTAFQPWWLDLCGLGLLLFGLWTFRRAAPAAQTPEAQTPPIIALDKTA
jgi:uncharacterized protein